MAVYLYTPPTWRNPVQFEDSALVAGVTTSTVVYRLNNTWYNVESLGIDNPVVADVDVDDRTGLRLLFIKPTVVPGSLHDELAAVEPANDSWTEGTLTLL